MIGRTNKRREGRDRNTWENARPKVSQDSLPLLCRTPEGSGATKAGKKRRSGQHGPRVELKKGVGLGSKRGEGGESLFAGSRWWVQGNCEREGKIENLEEKPWLTTGPPRWGRKSASRGLERRQRGKEYGYRTERAETGGENRGKRNEGQKISLARI